jgi:hypothetical protein
MRGYRIVPGMTQRELENPRQMNLVVDDEYRAFQPLTAPLERTRVSTFE